MGVSFPAVPVHASRVRARVSRCAVTAALLLACVLSVGCQSKPKRTGPPMSAHELKLIAITLGRLEEETPMSLRDVKLADAAAVLRHATRIPIYVDWPSLKAVGVDMDMPVSISGVMSADEAVLAFCGQASLGLPDKLLIGYEVVNGIVVIAPAAVHDRAPFRPYHRAPENQATYNAMLEYQKIMHVNYEKETTLERILLRLVHGPMQPYYIDWPLLERAGIKRSMPMTLEIGPTPAFQALHLALWKVNRSGKGKVAFGVIDGVLCVSTPAGMDAIAGNPEQLKTRRQIPKPVRATGR